MSLEKLEYTDLVTVIPAKNLNDIQDAIIDLEESQAGMQDDIDDLKESQVTIDDTLANQGEAADAKAVGDALKAIDGKLIFYAQCSTIASAQVKEITVSGVTSLYEGLSIRVTFQFAQSFGGQAKLKVNNLDAKPIYVKSGTVAAHGAWSAGEVVDMFYDGTNWIMVDGGRATTSTYGETILVTTATSQSEVYALTPQSINRLAYEMIAHYPIYMGNTSYAVGDRVRYGFQVWRCTTAIETSPLQFDETKWEALKSLHELVDELETKKYEKPSGGIPKTDLASGVQSSLDKADLSYDISTASGNIVTFDVPADGLPLKSLTVNIEPVQSGSGDPSPTNVRPISGWTGAKVTRIGKNLLDTSNYTSNKLNIFGIPSTLKPSTKYTFSIHGNTNIEYGLWLEANDSSTTTQLAYCIASGSRVTFTMPNVIPEGWLLISGNALADAAIDIDDIKPQLELGSTATDYEPYQGDTYDITFPSEAGTIYGGTLDVTSGVLTVDRGISNLGALDWKYSTDNARFETLTALNNVLAPDAYNSDVNAISSIYKVVPYDQLALSDHSLTIIFKTSAAAGKIWLKNSDYTDAATFKSAMSGVQLVYELATPITYQLTPQEVTTLLGTNNIWADAGDVSVEYGNYIGMTLDLVSEKADKVQNATANNFAALDANGNLKDSGHKASDFLTEHQSLAAYRTAAAQDAIDAEKQAKITASGLLKGDGSGGMSAAVAGTDYETPSGAKALGLTGASVGDLVRVAAIDANGKPTSWNHVPLCEIKTNPNLLDNWYFVGGGSQQGGWQFPINQRGQTSYNNIGYGIDRWRQMSENVQQTLMPDCLRMNIATAISSNLIYCYYLLEKPLPPGKYTISFLTKEATGNGAWYFSSSSSTAYNIGNVRMQNGLASVTFTATGNETSPSFYLWHRDSGAVNDHLDIIAAKLELGDTQTLAHQENGVWVLNEIPDYREQLEKCQRYYFDTGATPNRQILLFSTSNAAGTKVGFTCPIPVTMRNSANLIVSFTCTNIRGNGVDYVVQPSAQQSPYLLNNAVCGIEFELTNAVIMKVLCGIFTRLTISTEL